MSFNGTGTFVLLYNWQTDAANGLDISSSRMQGQDQDIANGLSNCITRDGQGTPTANLPMNGYRHINVGNSNSPTTYASSQDVQNGNLTNLTSVAGTDTITATAGGGMNGYANGQIFSMLPAGANTTTAPTLNINGLGPLPVLFADGTALTVGAMVGELQLFCNGTQFLITSMRSQTNDFTRIVAPGGTISGALSITGALSSSGGLQSNNGYVFVGQTASGQSAVRLDKTGALSSWNGTGWNTAYTIWTSGNFTPGNYLTTSAAASTYATITALNGKQASGNYAVSEDGHGYGFDWDGTRLGFNVDSSYRGPLALYTDAENRFYATDGTISPGWYSGTAALVVTVNGQQWAIPLNASDARIKENVQPATISALDKLEHIKLHAFNFKEGYQADHTLKHDVGFIAQQLAEVDPTFVIGSENEEVILQPSVLPILAHVVKGIQELRGEVSSQSNLSALLIEAIQIVHQVSEQVREEMRYLRERETPIVH